MNGRRQNGTIFLPDFSFFFLTFLDLGSGCFTENAVTDDTPKGHAG